VLASLISCARSQRRRAYAQLTRVSFHFFGAYACTQLRTTLAPWVLQLLALGAAPAGMRIGVGGTSASLFAAAPPTARRLCGGALRLHQDYNIEQWPKHKHAFNIILLMEDVGERDGPTYVYEGSRSEVLAPETAVRDLERRGYARRRLIGRRGDVFVFHAADWHGVEGIMPPARVSRRCAGSGIEDQPEETADEDGRLRANLVLGAWHPVFDGCFAVYNN
jgi:hypothetical protein